MYVYRNKTPSLGVHSDPHIHIFMQVVELDLSTVDPCCSGPKRPQDKVSVSDMKQDFETCLGAKVHSVPFQCKPH